MCVLGDDRVDEGVLAKEALVGLGVEVARDRAVEYIRKLAAMRLLCLLLELLMRRFATLLSVAGLRS